ncbi:CRISPR-associated helicase Cas3' [Nocardia sp. NPDC003482]
MPWAKTDRNGISRARGGPAWNPLPVHMFDVAAVVLELWDRYLPAPVRVRLAQAFGGGDELRARSIVAFLVALHDLGKASDCFLHQFGTTRGKTNGLAEERKKWEAQARSSGLPLADRPDRARKARHEHITAAHLARLLDCECAECDGSGEEYKDLHTVAFLLAGHHGHIPRKRAVNLAYAAAPAARWTSTYADLLACVAARVGVDLQEIKRAVRFTEPAALTLFAGLVVLADWVASSESHFTYRVATDSVENWWAASQSEAAAAVTALRLVRWQPRDVTWPELWPNTEPRGFQRAVMDLLPDRGPALTVIESDTGSGKTRAALWCALHLARTCGYTGLYMAMPTRAATNQIALELRQFIAAGLDKATTANLAVVHGTAAATPIVHELLEAARLSGPDFEDLASAIEPTMNGQAEPTQESRVVLDPWYLRRCLGLVSPFGVGTVDQIVLAAQPSSHWFLRMLGLACKTVIIDEAHAYELYQQQLLQTAVAWLANAGASIVVLSATLPDSVRSALTAGWCEGHKTDVDDPAEIGPIMMVDAAGRVRRGGPAEPPSRLHTVVSLENDPGTTRLATMLLDRVEAGGIVGVIRTRVQPTVDLHAAVIAQASHRGWAADEIILLHGRMMPRDRLPLEQRLVEEIGPGDDRRHRNPRRPDRLIVIATQVIEQSLDIDFDWIVSDLAPIDLLIQRRGRLHRHTINDAERRASFRRPELTVLYRTHKGLPVVEPFDNSTQRPGTGDAYVYAPYTLAATWKTLTARLERRECETCHIHGTDTIHIVSPDDSAALIESVYGPKQTGRGPLGQLLDRTWAAWQAELAEERAQASNHEVKPFGHDGTATHIEELASDSAHGDGEGTGATGIRARSRLGDDDYTAVILYRQPDQTYTYDPAGLLPADLESHSAARTPEQIARRRQQQRDILLNTISLPARWFGHKGLPRPDTWSPLREHGPFSRIHTMILSPEGACLNEPRGLSYSPKRGLEKH